MKIMGLKVAKIQHFHWNSVLAPRNRLYHFVLPPFKTQLGNPVCRQSTTVLV